MGFRKDYFTTFDKADNRIRARWERGQTDPVSARLGRHRHRMRAERRRMLEKVNQLAKETDWRGDLARSVQGIIDIDDCNEDMYRHAAE
jgi:hypothetical protein